MKNRHVTMLAILMIVGCTTAAFAEDLTGADNSLWQRYRQWRRERIAVTDIYRANETGAAFSPIQDTRMTDLIYGTVAFATIAETRRYRPGALSQTLFYLHAGIPAEEDFVSGEHVYLSSIGIIEWSHLRQISNLPLSIGGAAALTGHLRFYDYLGNSALNGDTIVSVAAAARWEEEFTLFGRPTTYHVQLSTPAFSFVARYPQFNLSGIEVLWAAPWNMPALRLSIGLSRLLSYSEENRWNLNYRYDFYAVPGTVDVLSVGTHTLTIGYALKTM